MSNVFCPICERQIDWDRAPLVRRGADGRLEPVVFDPYLRAEARNVQSTGAYRPCGPLDQQGTHLLPYDYAEYTPVSIGLVGQTRAGKTHLLAAMIHRLCSNDLSLAPLGLEVSALDLATHQRYLASCVHPLIREKRVLPRTDENVPVAFCDALKITNSQGRSFAVTFFDLAGELLARPERQEEIRFYASVKGLIFVVDPDTLPRPGRVGGPDPAFDVALRRLEKRDLPPRSAGVPPMRPVAAATVVAKADLIRFTDGTVSDWLALSSGEEEADLSTVEQESADVYAYLSRRRAGQLLRPAQLCYRSTLHFASATNGPPEGESYPGAFRQCRVLKPLLAVFAMTGILDESLLSPRGEPV